MNYTKALCGCPVVAVGAPNSPARIDQEQRRCGRVECDHEHLMNVIRDVHGQIGDDVCWMDIDRIFAAASLPVPDRRVGDPKKMLKNCERFISTMCLAGKWVSYRDLLGLLIEVSFEIDQSPCAFDSAGFCSTHKRFGPCLQERIRRVIADVKE